MKLKIFELDEPLRVRVAWSVDEKENKEDLTISLQDDSVYPVRIVYSYCYKNKTLMEHWRLRIASKNYYTSDIYMDFFEVEIDNTNYVTIYEVT